MIVICRTMIAKEGNEDEVTAILVQLAVHSTAEPGNEMFLIHHSTTEPRRFLIYEQYDAQDSFNFHLTSPHFDKYFKNELPPLLETQDGGMYELIRLPE